MRTAAQHPGRRAAAGSAAAPWARLRRAAEVARGEVVTGLRALALCPVILERLPGLNKTTANPRCGQFNVFARLEVTKSDEVK